jgi:hypothetical protein
LVTFLPIIVPEQFFSAGVGDGKRGIKRFASCSGKDRFALLERKSELDAIARG